MSHVLLIGFMGAGKSTVGRLLAESLDRPFVDLDDAVEQAAGMPVSMIFEDLGEDRFRMLETEALRALIDAPPSVVACGGGVVVRDENRALLGSLGAVVYLKVSAGESIARISDTSSRPLLAGPGAALAATSLLAAREALYSAVADISVDTEGSGPGQIAQFVQDALEDA